MSASEKVPAGAPAEGTARLGTVISGRYLVRELLGTGGMGAVYLAEHTHMKKRVALKLLHPEMSDNAEVQSRFEREAMAAAHVEHPNVAAATDFGRTEDGAYFLVLEYVEGESLRDALVNVPFPPARALRIARQIALALDRAHAGGIVHRDLKPENVMLVKREAEPDFVKVLDFGIAKVLELGAEAAGLVRRGGHDPRAPLTKLGTILGTPEYMSPEQALGESVTPSADLYGVGVMLFEMLTGKHPFSPPDRAAMLSFHIVAPVPTMEDRAPDVSVPPVIEVVVRRLLEKEPKNRFPSARALVEAIDEAAKVSGLDIGAPPAPPQSSVVMAPPSEPRLGAAKPWAPNDAFAQTFVGTPAPELPTAMPVSDPRPSTVATLRAQSKRTLMLVAAALPIGFLLILGVVLLLRRGKPALLTTADAASPIASAIATKIAPDDRVSAAVALGSGALEALVKEFPGDHALPPKLATAYVAENKNADALRVIDTAVSATPGDADAFVDLATQLATKGRGTDDDAAFALLESKLGPGGIDALIEMTAIDKSPGLRSRAGRILAKPDVRDHASAAALVYIDLKAAQSCGAKHDLMPRAKQSGDARVLPTLKALQTRGGCGFLRRNDCWPCLHRDGALDDAASAIEARGSK